MDYENLPNDVLRYSMLSIPINSLTSYCRTSKKISQICMSEEYWRLRLQQDYPMFTKPIDIGYRDYYTKIYSSPNEFVVNRIEDFNNIPLGVKILKINNVNNIPINLTESGISRV